MLLVWTSSYHKALCIEKICSLTPFSHLPFWLLNQPIWVQWHQKSFHQPLLKISSQTIFKSLVFVSRSTSLVLSTIFTSCSRIYLSTLGFGRLNASRNMSLMSYNTCLFLCSLLSNSWFFFLVRSSYNMLIYSIVIDAKSNFGSSITSSKLTSP